MTEEHQGRRSLKVPRCKLARVAAGVQGVTHVPGRWDTHNKPGVVNDVNVLPGAWCLRGFKRLLDFRAWVGEKRVAVRNNILMNGDSVTCTGNLSSQRGVAQARQRCATAGNLRNFLPP